MSVLSLQGGARKARRTGTQQQQRRERVDEDGDVMMGDEGGDGEGRFCWVRLFTWEGTPVYLGRYTCLLG